MIELNYWAVKPDWTEASPHIRLFGKIIHSEKNQKNTRFICRITSIFLIIILPIFMFYFVCAVDIGIPLDFNHGEKNAFWNSYFYFAPFFVEIIASYYLSNYSVIQISDYLYPTQTIKEGSKGGLLLLRILGIYYLFSIFMGFFKMLLVFS